MLLWMVEIILFGLNLCTASLKDENYSFMSLVRWRAPLRMKLFSWSVWLNGTITIIKFLLGYAIPPSHPFLIYLEILMMLALPGICSPNDIPPYMALGNINFQLNSIRLGKTLASLSMISLLVSSSYETNLISLIHHGILLMMQRSMLLVVIRCVFTNFLWPCMKIMSLSVVSCFTNYLLHF